jgi:EAL domain-containing protein (putative c-di-GMP-specific phosphodiesterase class I)
MPAIIEANRLTATNQETLEWYLCGTISDGERTRELVISKARFTTGRRSTCDLRLGWQTVSGLHAEFITIGKILCLRDLGSTNGTFVNGRRINTDTILSDGDIVQFGRAEFRVGSRSEDDAGGTVNWNGVGLPSRLIGFEELISGNGLVPHYQPIVKFSDASTVGFEVLARSRIPEFPTPREMFETAAQLDQEQELSEASRFFGVEKGFGMPADQTLYLNTHPTELQGDRLIRSLERLRDSAPNQSLSLEIHEAAVTDLDAMAQLRRQLTDLNIYLAYDDFGAGQARILDLVEVPPDVLKFDISLVRDINNASPKRHRMVSMLVEMVRDFGISPLAEGIETSAEAETCLQLGFELAQGFYFGRPAADWREAPAIIGL